MRAHIETTCRFLGMLCAICLSLTLTACGAFLAGHEQKQVGSVVDYLYPNAKEAPHMQVGMTYLRPPVRVGLAFVPGSNRSAGIGETEKVALLERVKSSFSQHEFIGSIEIIPTTYLRPGGGFANLNQVAKMFNVEVVALLSYDQVQFTDSNMLSVLYWTIVGAYVIHGNQYDIQTLVDASVFDVRSQKLLFRAPGMSQVKGSASAMGLSASARSGRNDGYTQAVDDLIPKLQTELDTFKAKLKSDRSIRVEKKEGYRGGGAMDGWSLALLAALALWVMARRWRLHKGE